MIKPLVGKKFIEYRTDKIEVAAEVCWEKCKMSMSKSVNSVNLLPIS